MISSESFIYHWTFILLICFIDESLQASSRDFSRFYSIREKHHSIARQWSSWTEWTDCSRTCGTGVRTRTRTCKVRASAQITHNSCLGNAVDYGICSMQKCPTHDKTFEEYQCSQRNGLITAGKNVEDWTPYHYSSNPCQLQCWSKSNFIVQSFGKMMDGTQCTHTHQDDNAICVNGRCSPVDCFGKIGSILKLDNCGICGGNNSTCVKIENTFWRRPRSKTLYNDNEDHHHYDYEEIVKIPSGATNILIKEASVTNFLALTDHSGRYFINGNWRVESPGKFSVHDSDVLYNRTWNGLETISSTGPLSQSLTILVLGSGDLPTVHYEYWLPKYSESSKTTTQQIIRNVDLLKKQSFNTETVGSVDLPLHTLTMTALPKLQGYNSYYHRNEILKSVPSWSIKRHSTYKNPLNILSFHEVNTLSSVDSITSSRSLYTRPVAKKEPTREQVILYEGGFNRTGRTRGAILTDKLVTVDDSGRPTGTSAQTRRNNKLFEYTVQKKPNKQNNSTADLMSNAQITNNLKRDTSNNSLKNRRKKPSHKRKRKSENENCTHCQRVKHQTKHFCLSDFVLRAVVISYDEQEQNIRYEMEITRSYKNKISILPREFIWTLGSCRCPNLKAGEEYILMGHTKTVGNRRESKLVVDRSSFVRKYTQKRARRMLRLVRDQNTQCRKYQ